VRKISSHEDEFAFRSAVSKIFVRLGFKKKSGLCTNHWCAYILCF